MSGSLNKIMLIGNLGKDPEIKATPSGQTLARFSLATTEAWKNPQGEKQTKTEWHNIVVWGKQAEIAEKFLRKGKQIYLEGRLQYREYTDQAGVKRNFTEIRCDNFVMLGRMEEGDREPRSYGSPSSSYNTGARSSDFEDVPPPPGPGYEEDIPF